MAEANQDNSIDTILSDIKSVITGAAPDANGVVVLTERVDNENAQPQPEVQGSGDSPANDDSQGAADTPKQESAAQPAAESTDAVVTKKKRSGDHLPQSPNHQFEEEENTQIPKINSLPNDVTTNSEVAGDARTDGNLVAKETADLTRHIISSALDQASPAKTAGNRSSLEEQLIAIMRPEISDWLNKNLPSIVKEVVEKEIKKVITNE